MATLRWMCVGIGVASFGLVGCAPPFVMRATSHELQVHLNPSEGMLTGRSVVTLEAMDDGDLPDGQVWVGLDLNTALDVSKIEVSGAELVRTSVDKSGGGGAHQERFVVHRLYLDRPARHIEVSMEYGGTLQQDVSSGEKAGQIHNFGMSAHISEEGIYLSPSGYWYPSPVIEDEETDPNLLLCNWELTVDEVEDYSLIASAWLAEDENGSDGDKMVWNSYWPITGLTLTGGRHDVWRRQSGDVNIRVHMQHAEDDKGRVENKEIAERYLDEAARIIERYEPLLGPFPFEQYTIIENFFSSGFAFPGMTLFGPTVMHMGDNSFRHGYLDHELVHSWWGCGVEVDWRDGNWCEALTSYCTNYYGFKLDGDEAGARKKRRDESNFLSRIKDKHDKPLGTYGLKDGVGRGIAYSKGSAVFDMLARQIGQETFWAACRDLTKNKLGKHANWDDLKSAFEEAGSMSLDTFYEQWIRGSGAPRLRLKQLRYDPAAGQLLVQLEQGEPAFDLNVPLRIEYDNGTEDTTVTLTHPEAWVTIDVLRKPVAVSLDPDYQVFRKLEPEEIMPTTAATRSARHLTIVVPSGELAEGYETVADAYRKGRKKGSKRSVSTRVADANLTHAVLAEGGVLVLGEAVRHPVVQELLAEADSAASWHDGGFSVGEQYFNGPEHAILMTVHHPDLPKYGITVYAGNSADALGNAAILGFYANSLLVFESHDRAEVVLRKDFESSQRLPVGG